MFIKAVRPVARLNAVPLTEDQIKSVSGGDLGGDSDSVSGSFTNVHRSVTVDYDDTDSD